MRLILAAATLSAVSAVCAAQTADQPGPENQNAIQQQQAAPAQQQAAPAQQEAAPIERANPNYYPNPNHYPGGPPVGPRHVWAPLALTLAAGQTVSPMREATAEPVTGVLVRLGAQSTVRAVSVDAQKVELSVEHGVVNVEVRDPAKDALVLVDLPGGQTQVLKNGLYTFNADTNTARVLQGEALAFPGADKNAGEKPLKVKEYKAVAFSGKHVKPEDFGPYDARADLLPGPAAQGYGGGYGRGYGYGYGPYGDGFYGGSPYWAGDYYPWGYPYYGYGYPWGWYPWGVGIGFGYYGGWGFHGGWGGGFHGRR